MSGRGVVLALPEPSKSTISHYRLFYSVLAVYRVIVVANFDSRVYFYLSRVRVKLSVLLKFYFYISFYIKYIKKN